MIRRLLIALSFLWTSHALASVPVGPRYEWFYANGYFHAAGGTAWVEVMNGVDSYNFVQTQRNDSFVELFDASRSLYVRLYPQAMYLKGQGETNFRKYYDGHWDDRRFYVYTVNSQTAYFLLGTSEVWRWVRPGEANVYLRETLRNNDQVQLYNAHDGYTISFTDGQIWMKKDGQSWYKYTDGKWAL